MLELTIAPMRVTKRVKRSTFTQLTPEVVVAKASHAPKICNIASEIISARDGGISRLPRRIVMPKAHWMARAAARESERRIVIVDILLVCAIAVAIKFCEFENWKQQSSFKFFQWQMKTRAALARARFACDLPGSKFTRIAFVQHPNDQRQAPDLSLKRNPDALAA